MAPLKTISRKELIRYLKRLEFDGPYSGGKHQFMLKGNLRLTIPNPHQYEIGLDLLSKILKQANISKVDWASL